MNSPLPGTCSCCGSRWGSGNCPVCEDEEKDEQDGMDQYKEWRDREED